MNSRSTEGAVYEAVSKVGAKYRDFTASEVLEQINRDGHLSKYATPSAYAVSQYVRMCPKVERLGRRWIPGYNYVTVYRLKEVGN